MINVRIYDRDSFLIDEKQVENIDLLDDMLSTFWGDLCDCNMYAEAYFTSEREADAYCETYTPTYEPQGLSIKVLVS